MYVSPAVRSIRDDPIEGESIDLLLRTAGDTEAVADRVREVGGTVEETLEFDTLRVAVAQETVTNICTLSGVTSVETAATLEMDPGGAGEDIEPGDG